MRLGSLQSEEEASVQMAPLIDCVFILLIFFLVTSMLQKPHNELLVNVPHSGAAETPTEKLDPVVLVVTATDPDRLGGRRTEKDAPEYEPFVLMGEEKMTRDLLERRLRQIAQESLDRPIRIDAEAGLLWRHIVPIVDLCRFHGLVRVDVRTP